ncbi:efflux RND transporter periplasmic adaptor subunit [Arhodomonas sp. AD133]|uniref:efflux RND transporter periplasmic adaptor subunit n=1 Tax=Arhodomonas sp. AD133 TaxID=3415009 RepID=UPI003EBDF606
MRNYRRLVVWTAVLVLLAAGVWYWSRPAPPQVRIAPVERGAVERTVSNTRAGTVKAARRARISPSTSGQVVSLPVHEGARVEAGDLLLELWNDDIRAELEVTRVSAEAADARADQLCVQARAAKRDADRIQRLRSQESVSEEAADRAVSERDASAAACLAARKDATTARHRIAAVEAALARTRLHAPFDGVVAEVNAELGEIVTPSPIGIPTPPAVDLIDTTTLLVSAPIDEVDAPAVAVDMPARISLDAFPGRVFDGRVTRIAPYVLDVEKQARTVEVEVTFTAESETQRLLPGYSADALILVDVATDVLRVPSEAMAGDDAVLVVTRDGRVARRQVTTGIRNWDFTAVRAGLDDDDRVIVSSDHATLTEGMAVRITEDDTP